MANVKLLIFAGESTAAGPVYNAGNCSAGELITRPKVQVYVHSTGKFQNLNVGLNNKLSVPSKTLASLGATHGFEVEIANRVEASTFNSGATVYICPIARGSSFSSEFQVGYTDGNGINVLQVQLDKIAGALAAIVAQGNTPVPYFIIRMGINDQLAAVSGATFTTNMTNWITSLRAATATYGTTPIVMTKCPSPTYTGYNASTIPALATAVGTCTVVDTSGSPTSDGAHETYSGQKTSWGLIQTALGF